MGTGNLVEWAMSLLLVIEVRVQARAKEVVEVIEGQYSTTISSTKKYPHWFSRRNGQAVNPGNNLHVSGLSSDVTSQELEALFATAGRVRRPCLARQVISS